MGGQEYIADKFGEFHGKEFKDIEYSSIVELISGALDLGQEQDIERGPANLSSTSRNVRHGHNEDKSISSGSQTKAWSKQETDRGSDLSSSQAIGAASSKILPVEKRPSMSGGFALSLLQVLLENIKIYNSTLEEERSPVEEERKPVSRKYSFARIIPGKKDSRAEELELAKKKAKEKAKAKVKAKDNIQQAASEITNLIVKYKSQQESDITSGENNVKASRDPALLSLTPKEFAESLAKFINKMLYETEKPEEVGKNITSILHHIGIMSHNDIIDAKYQG